jgi:hypothetical protein
MNSFTKSEVMSALKSKNGIAKITFRKKNGEIREMLASLRQNDLLPTKGTKRKKSADNLMTVVDMEKNEWRSFYIDDIISLKKNVRRSYGVRVGDSIASFETRGEANKARNLFKGLEKFLIENAVDIRGSKKSH